MSLLFSELAIKDITLKNRIVVSPMCMYSSTDGFANDWHLVHLGSRATGGAGLVIVEATAVSPEGRISPGDLGLWKEEHIEELRRITNFLKSQNCAAGIQLAHAGRKASVDAPWRGGAALSGENGWEVMAPSPIPFSDRYIPPVEMQLKDIEDIVEKFGLAAERAYKAGFEVLEIHAAHGYLIHEFLSPLSNKRQDSFGGSFDNRIKFLMKILERVQKSWPASLPVFVRISATDWIESGWNLQESISLAKKLKSSGVDLIDCSSGGILPGAKIPVGPGYQVNFAKEVKKQADIFTGAVGLITTGLQAEEILQNKNADLIFMAREMLRDPYFPLHAAKDLQVDVAWPRQYERAKPAGGV